MTNPRSNTWSPELEERLVYLRNIGQQKWKQIAAELGRSKTACQHRYCRIIEPDARIKLYRRTWTAEAELKLIRLRGEGKTVAELVPILGRTFAAIQTRLERLKERPRGQIHFERRLPATKFVPPSIIADRDRRLLAERSLTAMFFGDPPPGQSALDRREALA